jgi:hypothetical protein
VLISECVAAATFIILAIVGFKKSLWIIVVALAAHGVFDFFHHQLIYDPAVPIWWPGFCLAFDAIAGAFLAMLLIRRSAAASQE